MKKVLSLFLAAMVLISVTSVSLLGAEPEITFGAWGRAVVSPAMNNEDGDTVPKDSTSWGGSTRIGFTIKGDSDYAGFQVDMKADEGEINTNDQQKIWVKPVEFITVEAGPTAWYDTLRGNGAYGAWNWLRFTNLDDEDAIFQRGEAKNGLLTHFDMNGIHVFAALDIDESAGEEDYTVSTDLNDDGDTDDYGEVTETKKSEKDGYTTARMFTRGQYGAGYEIAGVGMVRAQYIGKSYVKDDTVSTDADGNYTYEKEDYGVFNAAVKIDKLVPGLYTDLGIFVPTDSDAENMKIASYTNYKLGMVTPHLLGQIEMDKADAEGSKGTGIKLGVGADLDLGQGLGVNTDFRYANKNAVATEDVDSAIGFLVGVSKGYSNGKIGIGFEGTTHQFAEGLNKENPDDFAWAVPVVLEYWF